MTQYQLLTGAGAMIMLGNAAVEDLAAGLRGSLIRPGDADYDTARAVWNGMIDRRQGKDGKPYGIGFALALPDEWNGRLLMQGGGGLNGSVADPLGGNDMEVFRPEQQHLPD